MVAHVAGDSPPKWEIQLVLFLSKTLSSTETQY